MDPLYLLYLRDRNMSVHIYMYIYDKVVTQTPSVPVLTSIINISIFTDWCVLL